MFMKRPALYERTDTLFWNDPYIATQMLKAHLDPDTDAASRRPEFIQRCAGWVASLPLPENARLLDIGCGPGLYTRRLAARGLQVTGMDFSGNSIAYAREHDPHSEYVLRDYLTMEYDGTFDIVTLIYCDYGALIPGGREELLRRVHRALKPGGLFIFDVNTPVYLAGKQEHRSMGFNRSGFWSPKPHLCLETKYIYGDAMVCGQRYVIVDAGSVRRYNLWETCFTPQALLDEISPAGFSVEAFYGDMAGTPYDDGSETLCAVMKKE